MDVIDIIDLSADSPLVQRAMLRFWLRVLELEGWGWSVWTPAGRG